MQTTLTRTHDPAKAKAYFEAKLAFTTGPVELERMIKSGDNNITVIDVRAAEDYDKGHIPGAIDFSANRDKLASVLPKDKGALVVAYCGGPKCVAYKAAAKAAEKLGYTNVKHLAAGISGWRESGQKVEKGG